MDLIFPNDSVPGEQSQTVVAVLGSGDERGTRNTARGVSHPRLKRLFQHLELHPAERLTTEAAAKLACLQTNYFCALFRREMACTFADWQRAWRIARIAELILSEDLPITLAAERYGYVNMRSFERAFKAIYQISARDFRREFGASRRYSRTRRRRRS